MSIWMRSHLLQSSACFLKWTPVAIWSCGVCSQTWHSIFNPLSLFSSKWQTWNKRLTSLQMLFVIAQSHTFVPKSSPFNRDYSRRKEAMLVERSQERWKVLPSRHCTKLAVSMGIQPLDLHHRCFRAFFFLIVFLWGLASVAEFRSISIWWNVMLALPTCDTKECLDESWQSEDEECSLQIVGVSRRVRLMTILLNLLPRSILACCIFLVGVQYLLSVRNISDLILNSLALTFLVTVDEMLFAAFAGEQNAAWIESAKPIRGRSFRCVDRMLALTHLPFGMFMFFPILIWLSYYIIRNQITTVLLAEATYCLCDLAGSHCLASHTLSM